MSIIILGGDARDDHFYLFESDTAPSTLQELTRKVEDRNNRMRLKVLTVKIYKNSAAEDGGVVGDVKDLAKEMKLDYEILHMRDQLRPK